MEKLHMVSHNLYECICMVAVKLIKFAIITFSKSDCSA